MNKKLLLLLVIFLLFTGCQVKSTITINKDLTVLEEVKMSETTDFFNSRYKMLPINVVRDVLEGEGRDILLREHGYSYEIKTDEDYPYVLAKKTYSNLDEFSNNTIFKEEYFETLKVNSNDNLITLIATDFIKVEENDLGKFLIDNCSINIKLPYVVTDSNADSFNKRTNTYTWNIDSKTDSKEIKLTFDKNRIYVYNLVMYISIFIIILIIISIIIIVRKMINKNKVNNKI